MDCTSSESFNLQQFAESLKRQNSNTKKGKKQKGKKNNKIHENERPKKHTVADLIKTVEGEDVAVETETFPELTQEMKNEERVVNGIGPQHFSMISLLGKGATGRVILVRCTINNKVYAMKVLDKNAMTSKHAVEYALYERRVLSKLNHPFLVTLYCSFQTKDNLYLVTNFCQGGELFQHILERGFLTENEARFYIAEVILAVENLHACGIIHRDIKPENILLSETGHIVLCDFGVCYDRQQETPLPPPVDSPIAEEDDGMRDNRVCGTYDYMAPEVLCKGGTYGKAIDWWSVGCLLYEMTSGNPPFVSKDKKKLFDLIMKSKLKLPPFLSHDLHSLLKGLIERDVSKRLGATPTTFTQIGGVAKLKQHPFFKGVDWYRMERREIPPPIELTFESPIDTHYFNEKYRNYPLEHIKCLRTTNGGNTYHDFTFVCDEFADDDQFSPIISPSEVVETQC